MNWTLPGIIVAACILLAAAFGFHRGFIKEAVSTLILFLSVLLVWFVNPYVNQFLRENTPLFETVQETAQNVAGDIVDNGVASSKTELNNAIDNMPLPAVIRESIQDSINSGEYKSLGASSFTDFMSKYLAEITMNGISFLVSFILANILLRVLAFVMNLLSNLPVVHGANKIAGALLGALEGVAVVWVIMLVLTVLWNTPVGKEGLEMVHKDTFLDILYSKNVFVKFFADVFYGKA